MATSVVEAETCLSDFNIQLEMNEPEITPMQMTPTMMSVPSFEIAAVVNEKLLREQRQNDQELAAAASSLNMYVDEPPSYSIFVVGGLLGGGENGTNAPSAIANSVHIQLTEKTATSSPAADAGDCRGCQSKKNGFSNVDEFSRTVEQKIENRRAYADCVEDDCNSDEYLEMQAWRQFTSNTTMHGIKYVFEDRPFTMRR